MENKSEQIKKEVEDRIDEEHYYNLNDDLNEIGADVPLKEKKIIWQPKDFSIRELATLKDEGELILQPNYQRKFVMKPKLSSRLIESILMNVPIPTIYLAEEENGNYSVIDGQQRLTSFISFIRGKFPDNTEFKLKGLNVLTELNKSSFSELEKDKQKIIRSTTIHCIIIKKESHPDIKFEIFERLNTGSIKLNEDEIRNTVYRGAFINLLSKLEQDVDYHKLVRKDNFKKRMVYRGMILRFLSLSEKSYLNYKPSIKQFCNKFLREYRNLDEIKSKEFEETFKKCLDLVKYVFGENAFRRYKGGDSENPNGNWTVSRINMALYDIQMCCFKNYDKNDIVPKADLIREALMELMTTDDKFIDSILIQTSDKPKLHYRFKVWMETLENIIGAKGVKKRNFDFNFKKRLFEDDPTCKICNQQILLLDDAEVDHIDPYSKGGETNEENAQLAHRYCNRAKSDKG